MTAIVSSGVDAQFFRPATGIAHHFSVWSPQMLDQYQISVGSTFTFQKSGLQIIQDSKVTRDVLGRSVVQHIFVSLGLHRRWLELSAELPVAWRALYVDPNAALAKSQSKSMAGDTRIYGKIKIGSDPVQFSLMPFLVVPTGADEYFFGTEIFSGGIYALMEKSFSKFIATANLALYFREKAEFRNIVAGHQAFYGLGLSYSVLRDFSLNIELNGRTRLQNPFNKKVDNPVEVMSGLHFLTASDALRINFGGGLGIIRGASVPEFRFLLGLVYKGA